MKRKTRRKLWNRVFKKVFKSANMSQVSLEETCCRIRKHRNAIKQLRHWHLIQEQDFRSGHETYGYKSLEDIETNLIYISDRFHAAFRLSWLVNVPEEVDKLKDT